jgi:uncharacterized protein (TIGR03086 family)
VTAGAGLLEQAAGYGLGSLQEIPPDHFAAATPCAGWNLSALLRHLGESVAVLHEAAEPGFLGPEPPDAPARTESGADLAGAVAAAICRLVDGWRRAGRAAVLVGGRPLPAPVVEVVAAIELAVHGWDVSVACGRDRPIPTGLALALTRALPVVAGGLVRPGLFAPAVPAPPLGSPGDRLVALLGRRPGR